MAEKVELDISIEALKKDLQEVRAELSRLGDTATSEFGQVSAAAKKAGKETDEAFKVGTAQGISDAINDLQKEYDDLAKSSATLKKALANATDPAAVKLYAENIARLELGMKKLEQTGKKVGVNLKENNREAGLGKQVFGELFGAFTKAALIAGAIEAVRRFVVEAVSLSVETDKATKSFTAFLGNADKAAGVVANLTAFAGKKFLNTEDVFQAGRGLLAFGENADNLVPVLGRIADLSAATGKDFNELTTIYGKARTAGVLYAEDINQLVEAGIPIIDQFAQQLGVSNDQVKKLASEGKISFEELQLALFNLTKEGSKFAGQAEAQAETLTGVWKGLFNEVRPAIVAIGDFFSDIAKGIGFILTDLVKGVKSLFGVEDAKVNIDVDYTGRDAYEQAKDDLYEQQRLEKEAAKRRAELNKQSSAEALKYAKELAQARIAALKDGQEKEIAEENFRFGELKRTLRKYHLDTTQAEEQHRINLARIAIKYDLIRITKQREALEAEKESIKNSLEEIATLNEQDRARLTANAARNSKAQEDAAELARANFEAALLAGKEVFFAQKRTDKEIEKYEKDVAKAREIFDLEQQRATLQRTLDFGVELSSAEKAILEQRIKNIGTQIQQLTDGLGEPAAGKKPFDFFTLIGLDPDSPDFDKKKEALKQAVSETIGILQDLGAARLEEAQAAVDAADMKVDAAESGVETAQKALEDQLEFARLGFASNVESAQKDLELAKQKQVEAEKQRQQALANQQKAQKQQLVLDTILQSANLITSATNIIKGFSTIPFVGVGLGIAAVTTMLVAFAKAKANAFAAVNSQKFRTGGEGQVRGDGVIAGPSHEQGGVRVPEYEGGEFFTSDGKRFAVVNRRMTTLHYDLLRATNKDDRPAMARYLERLTGGVSRDAEATGAVSDSVRQTIVVRESRDRTLEKMAEKNNRLLEENNAMAKKLLTLEQEREQFYDMGDHILAVKNGRERRIRKRV